MHVLGQWQLERAEYKEDLLNKIAERKDLAPVSIQELPHSEDDRIFLPVRLSGTFDGEHQFLYDNRIVEKRAGYHVYTPLLLDNGQRLLVNRGWVPQGKTRQDLPKLPVSTSEVEFTGLMDKTPSKGITLADNLHTDIRWPMVLQYIDIIELERFTGFSFNPMVVWMDAGSDNILHHELPVLKLDCAKNRGYAFQWYAMATALIIIYTVVNTKRNTNRHE